MYSGAVTSDSTRVGIIGASGYTGAELLRLLAMHPAFEVVFASGDSQAGTRAASLYPSLASAYGDLVYAHWDEALLDDVDLVFCGLPHGASQALMPTLVDRVAHVVDLAADFRLHDASLYPTWYGEPHACPELLDRFTYGLPELFADEVRAAQHVAVPGCYPTTSVLPLAPLVRAGAIATDQLIVDAASGVSGAGRTPKPATHYGAVDENFSAYGVFDHRHTPEIEQTLGAQVIFTPHLVPMNRGILTTCYARPASTSTTAAELRAVLHDAYDATPFVVVVDEPPHTKATLGSNMAQVWVGLDDRTGWVVAMGALDNLVKGASGQAVQCANLVRGYDEALGLPTVGMMP
jgi:N-acetyl-gamma-glutamyl-phosphate reductase